LDREDKISFLQNLFINLGNVQYSLGQYGGCRSLFVGHGVSYYIV
jgi:hypothetical protein